MIKCLNNLKKQQKDKPNTILRILLKQFHLNSFIMVQIVLKMICSISQDLFEKEIKDIYLKMKKNLQFQDEEYYVYDDGELDIERYLIRVKGNKN